MTNVKITTIRKNLFKTVSSCIKYNDVITISTKEGNAILMSEADYNSLMESLALSSIPGMYESIAEGAETPLEECEKVEWK